MTDAVQIAVDLLTALGAVGAFAVSLWNAHQIPHGMVGSQRGRGPDVPGCGGSHARELGRGAHQPGGMP